MKVVMSEIEKIGLTHPEFGLSCVRVCPEVRDVIDIIFPSTINHGLAGIIKAAQSEGILPYGAGNNQAGSVYYIGVKNMQGAKRFAELDLDGTAVVVALEEHDFNDLVKAFEHGYHKKMSA